MEEDREAEEREELDLKQFLQGSTNQGYVDCKKSLDAGKRINYKFDEL